MAKVLKSRKGEYNLLELIGGGSFGKVFRAVGLDGKFVAIKILCYSSQKKRTFNYNNEVQALSALNECGRTPKVFDWGQMEGSGDLFIVLELFADDLETYIVSHSTVSGRKQLILQIAEEALVCLQAVHKLGFLHMDIKPSNFLLRSMKSSKPSLVLTDFGLAMKYLDKDGKHIRQNPNGAGLRGSLQFASINCLDFNVPSRRDDLESLAWMLLYLHQGNQLLLSDVNDAKGASSYKKYLIRESQNLKCWRGFPELLEFMETCVEMNFYDEPDYDHLIGILRPEKKKRPKISLIGPSKDAKKETSQNVLVSNEILNDLIIFTEREQWMQDQDDERPASNIPFVHQNKKFLISKN